MPVGDFTGDHVPDIVTVGVRTEDLEPTTYPVAILPGLGDGTFGTRIESVRTKLAQKVAAGDFDRDGENDLALGSFDDQPI